MPVYILCMKIALIFHARAAELLSITVECLNISAGARHTDPIIMTYLRRKVADCHDEIITVFCLAHKGYDAVLIVVAIDPLKTIPVKINLPECLMITIEFIQCPGVFEHFGMHRIFLYKMPVQTVIKVPFNELAEFTAHEQKLLARMSHPVTEEVAQTCELLPVIARHFADQ